jgi:c(7)-type cytochrome triheme protein
MMLNPRQTLYVSGAAMIVIAILVSCVSPPQPASENQPVSKATAPDSATGDNRQAVENVPAKTTMATQGGVSAHSQPQVEQQPESSQPTRSQSLLLSDPDYEALDGQIIGGKKLSSPRITGSVPPRDDQYHDRDNNAIVVLQSPTEAMADFPRDRRNEVDWVKTLEQGLIEPRADLQGENEMVTMDLDIVMKNTQFMPHVKFPHIAHTKWLACENCHPKIFVPQEGANPISMNKVLRGEYCGVCHDKVAFSLFVCERCHSVPHEGSGPAWWK